MLESIFQKKAQFITTFNGHRGAITSLAFSSGGEFLASGGQEGCKIWNIETKETIPISNQNTLERTRISFVHWAPRTRDGFDVLCYGNIHGFFVTLQHIANENRFDVIQSARLARGGEVISIATVKSGHNNTRIAVGTRDKCIAIFELDYTSRVLTTIRSDSYDDGNGIVPKALAFDNNSELDLLAFGLFDGGVYCFAGEDGRIRYRHQFGSQIGFASVDIQRKLCVVDNVTEGFSLFKMDIARFARSFKTRQIKKTYPRAIVFADDSKLVVSGSDHGQVYIFARKDGALLRTLKHSNRETGVECVAAHDNSDGSVWIASATTTVAWNEVNPIHIWRWNASRKDYRRWNTWGLFMFANQLVAAIVTIGTAVMWYRSNATDIQLPEIIRKFVGINMNVVDGCDEGRFGDGIPPAEHIAITMKAFESTVSPKSTRYHSTNVAGRRHKGISSSHTLISGKRKGTIADENHWIIDKRPTIRMERDVYDDDDKEEEEEEVGNYPVVLEDPMDEQLRGRAQNTIVDRPSGKGEGKDWNSPPSKDVMRDGGKGRNQAQAVSSKGGSRSDVVKKKKAKQKIAATRETAEEIDKTGSVYGHDDENTSTEMVIWNDGYTD